MISTTDIAEYMDLPKDPNILYSIINMKLRDMYGSLDELCASEGLPRKKIEELLRDAGFEYDSKINSFR